MSENSITLTTGEVISIGTNVLATPVSKVVEALNNLTHDNLYSHQLPRAVEHCRPCVVEACPWVADIPNPPDTSTLEGDELEDAIYGWVDKISAEHGEAHEVPDLSHNWVRRDPLAELAELLAQGEKKEGQ